MTRSIDQIEKDLNEAKADLASIRSRNEEWAESYLDLLEEIPGGFPDGTGILSPLQWVRWAKKQLGYES